MKRFLLLLALASPAFSASANNLSAGVFFGSPMSGLTVKSDMLKVSLGADTKGIAVDGVWNLGEWLARPEYFPMYVFAGGQWVDDDVHTWGPRAGLGLIVPLGTGNMELFAEAGSTWYWQEDAEFKLEAATGIRVYF